MRLRQLLPRKEAVPTLNRVSFVESQFAIEGRASSYRPSIEDASHALSVEMIDIQYRSAVQLVRAIDAFGAQPSGGLIVGPATTRIDAGTILELAAQYRLPTIHANREFAENGGLISYGGNPLALWARASFFVDRILRGAKVSELPVEFPAKFQLVVNLKTASDRTNDPGIVPGARRRGHRVDQCTVCCVAPEVRSWPQADMPQRPTDVRC
jgi:putative ABC transport system substrate-binding protein